MGRNAPPRALTTFLKPYDKAVQELALGVRAFVLDELGPCHESIYDAYNAVAMAYGPSDRFKDAICHIAVYTKHVNLGFNRGATLADPAMLLQGSGKSVRHVTIRTLSDLKRPEILDLLRSARKQSDPLPGSSVPSPSGVTSVVKGSYPTKRRPDRSLRD